MDCKWVVSLFNFVVNLFMATVNIPSLPFIKFAWQGVLILLGIAVLIVFPFSWLKKHR